MPALDWSQCPGVESVPGKVSGAWVFRNSRMPVKLVFENLEDGMTIDEIIEQYDVTREQVKAVIDFAARSLDAGGPPSVGQFMNCPRCNQEMERRFREPNETAHLLKPYYFSEWDYCKVCRHVQHYEKYKVYN